MPGSLTVAQAVFGLALLAVSGLIAGFSLYVISTTIWGNRWFRKIPRDDD